MGLGLRSDIVRIIYALTALALLLALNACNGHKLEPTTSILNNSQDSSTVPPGNSGVIDDPSLFTYKAFVKKVYDGDTITVDVDLGFHTWIHDERIRLYRINAPEVKGDERPQGLISRDWLRERLLGKEILIHTIKDKKGKYGRYLAEIYLDGVNINDELVANGLAEYKDY